MTPAREVQLTQAKRSRAVKHGLFASLPMICRNQLCPYKDFCSFQKQGLVVDGERCIKEIGQITDAADRYYSEFKVDPTDPGQRVDAVQIQQLINLEVLMERATMLLAKGDLVETIDVAFSPDGQDILQQPRLHSAADALPKLQRKHMELLQLLMATRKNKVEMDQSTGMSLDQMLAALMKRGQQVRARFEMMKRGELEAAEKTGWAYGIEHAKKLPSPDVIDQES